MLDPTELYVNASINNNSACHVFFQNFLGVVTILLMQVFVVGFCAHYSYILQSFQIYSVSPGNVYNCTFMLIFLAYFPYFLKIKRGL
jgi:hypothetical protein